MSHREPASRSSSEQLVDLHVYVIPRELWREKYNNIQNQDIEKSISLGFIRIDPEAKIYTLRSEIIGQLESEFLPRDFVFLKCVGRCLTKVKSKQEYQLKAKNFVPHMIYSSEVYLLESSPSQHESSTASSTRPTTQISMHHPVNNSLQQRFYESSYKPYVPDYEIDYDKESPKLSKNLQFSQMKQDNTEDDEQESHQSPECKPYHQKWHQTPSTIFPKLESSSHKSQHHSSRFIKQSLDNSKDTPLPFHNTKNSYQEDPKYHINDHTRDFSPKRYPAPSPSPHDTESVSPQSVKEMADKINDEYLPPVSATPPHSADMSKQQKGRTKHDPRLSSYTTNTNDSGVFGLTPENYFQNNYQENLERKRKNEMLQQKIKDEKQKKEMEERKRQYQLQEEKGRQQLLNEEAEEKQHLKEMEAEQQQLEGESPHREHKEQLKAREKKQRLSDERRWQEIRRLKEVDEKYENVSRFSFPDGNRKGLSTRVKQNEQKDKLLEELETERERRKVMEKQREEFVKRAKLMQTKMQFGRNIARNLWKKRYFEEKKRTAPLEDQCKKLRHELDILHRKLMTSLEGPKEKFTHLNKQGPSKKNNLKIQAAKLQHEYEELQRKVENAKMKLTAELKLRNQAENELRALKAELTQKKINLSLYRNQNLAASLSGSHDFFMGHKQILTSPHR